MSDLEPGRVYLVPMVAISGHQVVPKDGYTPAGGPAYSFPYEGHNANLNTPGIVATDERVDLGETE